MAKSGLPTFKEMFEREAMSYRDVSTGYDLVYRRRDMGKGIMDWSRERGEGAVEIWGPVTDQAGTFDATVELDLDAHEVISYSCTCAPHVKGKGMCPHTIALGANYLKFAGLADSP